MSKNQPKNNKSKLLLDNKLGITDLVKLKQEEEKILKQSLLDRMDEFFNINPFDIESNKKIHKILFHKIYPWAGEYRKVNVRKDGCSFSDWTKINDNMSHDINYLYNSLSKKGMGNNSINKIIDCYLRLNKTHPFRKGNGITQRIWLELVFNRTLNVSIDFKNIPKNEYMKYMITSINEPDLIKLLIINNLKSIKIYNNNIENALFENKDIILNNELGITDKNKLENIE